ncbi:histidine phosphatase family protein [Candidatus Thioglobus sp.]|nr:histidine phosphatase family protein [Candidatus Thioglobus sp.]
MKNSWLKVLVLFASLVVMNISYADDSNFWNAFKSDNHFVMLRHAIAPGIGDPSNFELDNCKTQRNLSIEGHDQAKSIGELFRTNNIENVHVFSSQWCRCLETAQFLDLGYVQPLPLLNSFFQKFEREDSQTDKLKQWLTKQDLSKPMVLVTHQVNISAISKVYPSSGELILLHLSKNGDITVIDRLQTLRTK